MDELRKCTAAERPAVLQKHRDLWRRLRTQLAALSCGKCWYCESKEIRSDNPVDHFRPKGRVDGCPDHPGYWWLAFDWKNYRYSCTYCNSRRRDPVTGNVGGKHDNFPLLNAESRAYDEADDIRREQPELLDPVKLADTSLLWFRDDGFADARVSQLQQGDQHRRAKTSIRLYHLNHTDVVEARLELRRRVRQLMELGTEYLEDWQGGNRSAETGYNQVLSELKQLTSRDAVFSTAAKHFVRGLVADDRHRWAEAV